MERALGLLTVVPMSVTVAGKVYQEGDPELTVELLLALAAGRTASMSRPSPGRFEKIFRGLLDSDYQSILSLHLSGELSRTVALALGLGCAQPSPPRSGVRAWSRYCSRPGCPGWAVFRRSNRFVGPPTGK